MQHLMALTARELKSFFYSPIAYVVGALFLILQGFVFWLLISVMVDPRVDPSITMAQFFFGGTFFFWFAVMLMAPLLTMRAFSEEKRTGSIELLLTAPVTDAQVVLAKFLGAWLSYLVFWLATLPYFLILRRFSSFDWMPVITGYFVTALLGSVLISIGILASSLTRNQVIAAVMSFVVILLLFSVGILEVLIHDPDANKVISYLSLMEHLRDFSKGMIDTRPVVAYASLTCIVLFFTGRAIGNPRWRS